MLRLANLAIQWPILARASKSAPEEAIAAIGYARG